MPDQERIYIGNVVLDEDNQEMLSQWLLDIINSLQGHGNGFDADTVDGFHATAFATAEQGLKADTALQSGIKIGSLELTNTTGTQYIKTDGIQIDSDVYTNLSQALNIQDEMILSSFLIELFNNLNNKYQNLEDTKVDKEEGKGLSTYDFNDEYKGMLDDFDFLYEEVVCPKNENPSQQVTRRVLNAGSVNHLQFILTTESLYAQYTEAVKKAWNNVFIFVDEDDYPDDYESPLDCPIETGYNFTIMDDENEESWLWYKGRSAKNWLKMISMNDLYVRFLQHADFEGTMRQIATTIVSNAISEIDTPAHINSLITRIEAPSIDHWQDYPFLSSELEFVYDVIFNGNSLCSKNEQGLLVADLSNITNNIESQLSSIQSNYTQLSNAVSSNTQKVNTLNQYVKKTDIDSALSNSNNPVRNSVITNKFSELSGQISQLNSNLVSLNESIAYMKRYQIFLILGVGQNRGFRNTGFRTPTDQQQEFFGAYSRSADQIDGVPKEISFNVSNRGNVQNSDNQYKYNDPDFIYARVIQAHAGYSATDHPMPWIYFTVNGVSYSRKIEQGNDYAVLNIRLAPGTYQVGATYIDTHNVPEIPVTVTQQLVVEKYY